MTGADGQLADGEVSGQAERLLEHAARTAEQLLEEARAEADRLRHQARVDADAVLAAARHEVQRFLVTLEAARRRIAADGADVRHAVSGLVDGQLLAGDDLDDSHAPLPDLRAL